MDSSENYSCADGSGLSSHSVTEEYWDSSTGEDKSATTTTATLLLLLLSVGFPTNLLIIVSILRQRLYMDSTFILLLNLALVNLLLCIFVLAPSIISGFAGGFVFGSNDLVRCRICQFGISFTVLGQLNVHILALLSLDRLIFIRFPFQYEKVVTSRRVIACMVGIWMLSFVISTFPLFGFGDVRYERKFAACAIVFSGETRLTKNIHYIAFLAVILCLSLSVVFAANIWVIAIVQRHARSIYSLRKTVSDSEELFLSKIKERMTKSKNKKHLIFIKVLLSIFLSNMLTWMPFLLYVFYISFSSPSGVLDVVVYVSLASTVVVHPVIQVVLCPELRKSICGSCILYCNRRNLWNAGCSCFMKCDHRKPKWKYCHWFIFVSASLLPDLDANT